MERQNQSASHSPEDILSREDESPESYVGNPDAPLSQFRDAHSEAAPKASDAVADRT